MGFVEVPEQGLPRLSRRLFARQRRHRLAYHGIGFLLVVPAVFHPQAVVPVPFCHARRVNPGHPSGVNAAPLANGLVGTCEELRPLGVELAEEHAVAVHRLAEQLDGGGRSQVGVFPRPQLPHQLARLVYFNGLHGGVCRVHRLLVPFVVPVVDEVPAIFQAHRFLRLRHPVVRGVQLPDGLSLAVDFLNLTFSPRDEQVAGLGHFLHAPWQEAFPAVHFAALARKFVNAAHGHVCHQQGAAAGEAGIAELPVYGAFFVGGQLKLAHNPALGNFHHHRLRRPPVLHKHHMLPADGLYGVDFRSLGGGIAPQGLAGLRHLGHSVLVGHQNVAVGHEHGIADFAALQPVVVAPRHLPVFHHEHSPLLALPGIEEVVAGQRLVHLFLGRKRKDGAGKGRHEDNTFPHFTFHFLFCFFVDCLFRKIGCSGVWPFSKRPNNRFSSFPVAKIRRKSETRVQKPGKITMILLFPTVRPVIPPFLPLIPIYIIQAWQVLFSLLCGG